MLKKLSILIAVIVLASCIRVEYKRSLTDSFVGMKEQELVTRIGPPDNVYEIGNARYLTYYKTVQGNNGYIAGRCKITFTFFDKKLDNWQYDGNICNQYINSIGLH